MSIPLPLQPDTLRAELDQVMDIIQGWRTRLEEGVPGQELPANDVNIEIFRYQLRAELMLASARLASVAEVLEG